MNRLLLVLWPLGFILSFIVGFILTKKGIPYLKKKRMGQTILDIGPGWHKAKEGTPTMGGLFFMAASCAVCLVLGGILVLSDTRMRLQPLVVLLFMIANGLIGFVDDYVKFIKHRNKGLSALQKMVLQFSASGAFLFALNRCGHTSTALSVPFTDVQLELGIFYYFFAIVFIVLVINAVNLTDGLDGLAGSTMSVVLFTFGILGILEAVDAPDSEGGLKALLSLCVLGGVIAFLCFNRYPAKIFMGDTGSLFLGAALSGIAFWMDAPLVIFLCGIVFLFEALTVVLQVGFFKLTHGKRLFKMAPFHHHLEKCGLSEVQIVKWFVSVTALGSIAYLCDVLL